MTKPLLRDLIEGEDSTPIDERTWPTPGQWLYQFNRLSPEERIKQVERTIRDAQGWWRCTAMEAHDDELKDLREKLALRDDQVRALQRELSTKKRILRQKNRRV